MVLCGVSEGYILAVLTDSYKFGKDIILLLLFVAIYFQHLKSHLCSHDVTHL